MEPVTAPSLQLPIGKNHLIKHLRRTNSPTAAIAPSSSEQAFHRRRLRVMGQTEHTHGRAGRPGPRLREEIGYHAVRSGDNPGEHTILFGMLGETIELRVAASNRDCYAQGALLAAEWLVGKPSGLYNMNDVLGL